MWIISIVESLVMKQSDTLYDSLCFLRKLVYASNTSGRSKVVVHWPSGLVIDTHQKGFYMPLLRVIEDAICTINRILSDFNK